MLRSPWADSVVVAGATDEDAVLFDHDLNGPVSGPVLCIDRVVLDGGVEPQPVALLAVIEGALERRAVAGGPAAAATTTAARTGARAVGLRLLVGVLCVTRQRGLGAGALGVCFGCFELGGDQRVVLGAKVDLLGVVRSGGALGGLLVAAARSGA